MVQYIRVFFLKKGIYDPYSSCNQANQEWVPKLTTVQSIQKTKAVQKYRKCVETGLLSIILSKNHADQMIPDVLVADENCVISRTD